MKQLHPLFDQITNVAQSAVEVGTQSRLNAPV
jgi:hypothetical protein